MTDDAIDLRDHRQTQALWPRLARWRRESPVLRLPSGEVYVARMSDCWSVLRDPATFANGNGFKSVEMPDDERMLGEMDPPRHPLMRRILRGSFDRHAVEAARPFARREATRLLEDWETGERRDLVATFTDRISNLVSFQLVGFPVEDTDRIVTWARELLHSEWPSTNRTERGRGLAGAFPEFADYLDALVERHRDADPQELARENFITRLARSHHRGEPLSPTVLRTLTAHIVLGGISTSTNLLGSILLRLLRDPGLHARLRSNPSLVPAAVEESLRLDPPVLFVMRVCRRPMELAGVAIAPGDVVLVGIASANRDEAVYDEPDAYRLDRGLPRHLSFSGGAHHCIGAAIARLVAQEVTAAFVDLFAPGDVALPADFEFEGVPVFLEYGPARLEAVRAA